MQSLFDLYIFLLVDKGKEAVPLFEFPIDGPPQFWTNWSPIDKLMDLWVDLDLMEIKIEALFLNALDQLRLVVEEEVIAA